MALHCSYASEGQKNSWRSGLMLQSCDAGGTESIATSVDTVLVVMKKFHDWPIEDIYRFMTSVTDIYRIQ